MTASSGIYLYNVKISLGEAAGMVKPNLYTVKIK
jgi:hypothetical protein